MKRLYSSKNIEIIINWIQPRVSEAKTICDVFVPSAITSTANCEAAAKVNKIIFVDSHYVTNEN